MRYVVWIAAVMGVLGVGGCTKEAVTPRAERAVPPADVNTVQVKNLKVLAVLYRGEPESADRMDDHSVTQARGGVELGRLFYYRNSRARLNIELDWMLIDNAAPDTDGPTMANIEQDVRARGVTDGDYDGLLATGVGLKGNFGGFTVLGGAGGCYGSGSPYSVDYPGFDPDIGYGWAWIFAHEFQHALDLVIVERSGLQMLHAHPYADCHDDFFKGYYVGGEHWDWIALTLREFDDYLKIKGVRDEVLVCVDADADGLADDDPRLPMDENRFGSDPARADTDGDGLDDLGEFVAGRYAGSDPRGADTDGDGLSDAEDPYPLVTVAATLPYVVAGAESMKLGKLFDGAFLRNDARGGEVAVYGAWNEDGLYLRFLAPSRLFNVRAKIDGSAANGFWEGGDTYVLQLTPEKAELDSLGLEGEVEDALTSGLITRSDCRLSILLPARLGQGVSKEINWGGPRDPQDRAEGLTLVDGRSIAFNFVYEFRDDTKVLITPQHTMYATRLVKPADAPVRVLLRAPRTTSAAVPVVEVLGVGASTEVRVTEAGAEPTDAECLGARLGPGPVRLVGLDTDGTFELVARAGDAASEEVEMVVDRTADVPALEECVPAFGQTDTDQDAVRTLVARCEPGAELELWWGLDGVPVAPLDGARADAEGRVTFGLGPVLTEGWVVTGFEGSDFDRPVFIESWDRIDRHFESGPADERLPADGFSYRFEGLLRVAAPGRYTFELDSDDGSRLFVNDEIVINHWGRHGMEPLAKTVHLDQGLQRLRIDYQERDGSAGIRLRWAPAGEPLTCDVPVRRGPLPDGGFELYGVQVDRLGNRSAFSEPVMVSW